MKDRHSKLPALVFVMCKNGAHVVGSAAKFIIGEQNSFTDFDLIVPPEKWFSVSLLIPKTAKLNSHGGLKFKYRKYEIDIWPCSIEQHLRQCKPGMGKQEHVLDYINNKVFTAYNIGTK